MRLLLCCAVVAGDAKRRRLEGRRRRRECLAAAPQVPAPPPGPRAPQPERRPPRDDTVEKLYDGNGAVAVGRLFPRGYDDHYFTLQWVLQVADLRAEALSNGGRIKAGTPYLWEWRTEVAPYVIQNPDTDVIIDSHASSLSYDAPLGTNKFYALFDLNPNSTGLARYDTVSGQEDEVRHDVYLSPDYPNHIQYLDGDASVLTGNKVASPSRYWMWFG